MNLKKKKRMIASLKKVGPKRIKLNPEALDEVKNAITKSDARSLIKRHIAVLRQKNGTSRSRARKTLLQKRKGRHKGSGSRKGKKKARKVSGKTIWVRKIRAQRNLLRELRESKAIENKVFSMLYRKSKGGFFRSRRHIKIYLEEHNLAKPKPEAKK